MVELKKKTEFPELVVVDTHAETSLFERSDVQKWGQETDFSDFSEFTKNYRVFLPCGKLPHSVAWCHCLTE